MDENVGDDEASQSIIIPPPKPDARDAWDEDRGLRRQQLGDLVNPEEMARTLAELAQHAEV